MRINNNIMAMNTHRQYAINNDNMAKATEKLSSGYRINSAADDAAGLAISEKMRSQIRGLDMASKNSEDAISLVQTAEGALEETESILQRMRELAVQSASDTNEGVDRSALQAEYEALTEEIDDIATKTAFNKRTLLDGSLSTNSAAYAAESTAASADQTAILSGLTVAVDTDTTTMAIGEYAATFTAAENESVVGDGDATAAEFELSDGTNTYTVVAGADGGATGVAFAAGEYEIVNEDDDVVGTLTLSAGAATAMGNANAFDDYSITLSGGAAITIQTGANEGDTLAIEISDMTAEGLAVDTSSVADQASASSAITTVDNAIKSVSTQRSKLGAYQNRLEHKINNLDTSSENLSAAESRIRDIDMAKEMTQYTQTSILVQAATSMLAQANAAPQNVLTLLQ